MQRSGSPNGSSAAIARSADPKRCWPIYRATPRVAISNGFVIGRTGRDEQQYTVLMCAASLDSLGQQFGQAEQVIGGHHECELPIDVQVRRATKL